MISRESWIEWLQLKGLSERTLKYYCFYSDKLNLDKLSPDSLLDFLKKNNNGVVRAMIKNLLYFLRASSLVPLETKDWVSSFEIPKKTGRKKKRILKVLTKEQVHILAKNMTRRRDSYMVLLTFYLGLRVQELLSLNLKSFDWKNAKVRIIGKGNKERILPLVPELHIRLTEWINEEIEKDPDFYNLFQISVRRWQTILEKHSRKTLDRKVNPHLLRHSCGSFLHSQGLDLKEIADFLGHSSVQTAQIYVHLDKTKFDSKILGAFK